MKKTLFGFLIALGIGINTAIWLRLKNQPGISAENGPMENFQAVCLGLSFLFWLIASAVSKNRAEKILLIGLALFNLLFLVNEMDTRKMDLPLLTKLLHGRVRNLWLWSLWLVAGFFFFRNAKAVWDNFLNWLRTSSGVLMMVSGIFWIVSGLNDKSLLGRKNLYWEELMEVNSTPLMLLSAILFLVSAKRTSQLQENQMPSQINQQA